MHALSQPSLTVGLVYNIQPAASYDVVKPFPNLMDIAIGLGP